MSSGTKSAWRLSFGSCQFDVRQIAVKRSVLSRVVPRSYRRTAAVIDLSALSALRWTSSLITRWASPPESPEGFAHSRDKNRDSERRQRPTSAHEQRKLSVLPAFLKTVAPAVRLSSGDESGRVPGAGACGGPPVRPWTKSVRRKALNMLMTLPWTGPWPENRSGASAASATMPGSRICTSSNGECPFCWTTVGR